MNRHLLPVLVALGLAGCGASAPEPQRHIPKIYSVEQQEKAAAAMRAGDDAEATAAAERAIAHDPKYPEPYAIKATILARRGDLEAARAVLDISLIERPDFAEGYLVRGALLEELSQSDAARNDYTAAAERYARLVAENPDDPTIALKHALAEYLRGGTAGLRAINTIVSSFPDYQPGRFVKERMDAGDRAFAFRWITGQETAATSAASTKKDNP